MKESNNNKSIELSQKLANILDSLLETGDWESSLFLRNASKKLNSLKKEAHKLVDMTEEKKSAKENILTVPQGKQKVFISIYQIDGDNLSSWFHTIKALASYNISRPTYNDEINVKELISSKADMKRHGYVVAVVNESDIINIDPPLVDTLGHELLILKEGSVHTTNLIEFIHANKRKYKINANELVFSEEIDRK